MRKKTLNKKTDILKIVEIVAIIVLLGLLSWFYIQKSTPKVIEKVYYKTKIDTIYKYDTDTLVIKVPALKTIYKEKIDTIVITNAFEKSFDTATANAKLEVSYYFPADTFKVKLQTKITEILKTDTIRYEVPMPPVQTDEKKWYYAGAGLLGGIILGVIIAK